MSKYYGEESYFNEDVTFYKNVNIQSKLTTSSSIASDSITSNSFIKSGGTSSQFLKADGTVDSSTYVTSETVPQAFSSGTLMLFQQTAAPTGWTKQITHHDKVLRVVNGSASFGGTTSFSNVMTSRTPSGSVSMNNAAFTLTTNEMPAHSHSTTVTNLNLHVYGNVNSGRATSGGTDGVVNFTMSNAGGGTSHTHANTASFSGSAMDFAIQYVDLIIASKD